MVGWLRQVALKRKILQAKIFLPFAPLHPPSPGLQAEKYKIHTKKEQLDMRCRAKPFLPLHSPPKTLRTGIRCHSPDF